MDPEQRSPQESSVGSGRARADHQRFYRAYKACLKCRTRKTRCDITAEEFAAGMPCVRCRREMRECTFPSERRGTGSKPRGTNPRRGSDARRSRPSSSGHRQQAREPTPQDSRPGADDDDDNNEETDRQGPQSLAQVPMYQSYPSSRPSGQPTSIAVHDQDNGPSHPRNTGDQVFSGGVAESMMRTVVANGEDALNLLFEAAQTRTDVVSHHGSLETDAAGPIVASPVGVNTTSPAQSTPFSQPAMSTNLSAEAIDCWRAYRFTKMGWFSAEEAITYIDLFFQNMAPLSPIVDDFYADHANHYFLITREPLLCCMMLTISSRYNVLPVSGGESRGHMIHARMWDHCQHLLMRILLGQEKASKAKTRTIGSIEALLLLTEWQPRALHVPPAADGWDSDIMLTLQDQRDGGAPDVDNPSRGRWLEDVINPARRFDRLAWMAVGLAMSLAHELGIFETDEPAATVDLDSLSVYDRRYHRRRRALASILCSYQEQLSARLGRKSMMPQSVSHGVLSFNSASTVWGKRGEDWGSVMAAWTELTKLSRSISDILFPSATVTKHLLQSGRYISMIEHFCSLLADWERRHNNATASRFPFALVLEVEHLFTRIYANSLGLQAVVERTIAEPGVDPANNQFELSSTDYGFIQAVVDGCLGILKLSVKMHEQNSLRFAPVTIYLRITTASVFLLKGLGLGVSMTKLQDSLDVLTGAISALRSSRPDDLHLGSRYATLLEMHVVRLKENFVPTLRPTRFTTRPGSEDGQVPRLSSDFGDTDWPLGLNTASKFPAISFGGGDGEGFQEDWLTLPFDPSLQPYAPDEMQDFQLLGDNSLDFIWNLGP